MGSVKGGTSSPGSRVWLLACDTEEPLDLILEQRNDLMNSIFR